MLVLLPSLTFVATFLVLASRQTTRAQPNGGRLAFLQAAGLIGAYTVLSAELLSLLNELTTIGASIAWFAALIVVARVGWQKGWLAAGLRVIARSIPSPGAFEIVAISGFLVILGLLFVVAVLSPPNNTDSLLYHMSRVAHWAQNQSLSHYATGYQHQLTMPIFAELAILNTSLLWGGSQLANLIQWLSLGGALIGVTLIARLLGGNRIGQLAAAAFALSIPMGLMQATSTQNDYVVAFWLVSLACFASLRAVRPLTLGEELGFGLALALGLLTKGTYYPYAAPIVIWFFVVQVRGYGWRTSIARGLLIAIPVLVLNSRYWLRNLATFGGPLGPSEWVRSTVVDFRAPLASVSTIIRNIAMHFVTPYDELNARIAQLLSSTLGSFDQTLADLEFVWGWNHEDLAANPLHVLLVAVTALGLVLGRSRHRSRLLLEYSLVAAGTFVMLLIVVKPDVWGIRLQLPHWVIWAPVFGVAIVGLGGRYAASAAVIALLLTALPWTLFNRTRPLVAMRERDEPERLTIPCIWQLGCTTGSIVVEPKTTALFANAMSLRDPYVDLGESIGDTGCGDVGLRIDSHDREYLFWWLMDAPQSGIRIESAYPLPELAYLSDKDFRPCAIICTICGDRTEIHGLPMYADFGEVKLYVGDDYSPSAY
ncbi:MAG: glycosyltransferase family 39 protein [Anaerolineales bacterium]